MKLFIHCQSEDHFLIKLSHKVEVSITDHLRGYVSDLEKYKVVQIFRVSEDWNHEDCKK